MDWRHMPEMLAAGHAVYSELKNLCVWNKTNAGMGSFYRSKHELVFVWKNGTASAHQHLRARPAWAIPIKRLGLRGGEHPRAGRLDELAMHPTVKPVALVADAIKDCSRRGGLVLDPFCRQRHDPDRCRAHRTQGAGDGDRSPTSMSLSSAGRTTPARLPSSPRRVRPSKPLRTSAPSSRRLLDQTSAEAGSVIAAERT